jgi:hypothetical protein
MRPITYTIRFAGKKYGTATNPECAFLFLVLLVDFLSRAEVDHTVIRGSKDLTVTGHVWIVSTFAFDEVAATRSAGATYVALNAA